MVRVGRLVRCGREKLRCSGGGALPGIRQGLDESFTKQSSVEENATVSTRTNLSRALSAHHLYPRSHRFVRKQRDIDDRKPLTPSLPYIYQGQHTFMMTHANATTWRLRFPQGFHGNTTTPFFIVKRTHFSFISDWVHSLAPATTAW